MYRLISTLATLLPLAVAAPFAKGIRDSNAGCQAASTNLTYTVENFDFHASYVFTTPAHQNSWGFASFNLTNPALTYQSSCSAQSSQLSDFFYGTQIYTCTEPDGSTTKTTFDYNRITGQLDFNQTWVCSDQDPQWPVTFWSFSTVNLTLDCTDNTYQNSNWTLGQVYSDREVKCNTVTVDVKPYQMQAVA